MSKPHLQDLNSALVRRGWRIVAIHPGTDYDLAATWEVQQHNRPRRLFIDFEGMGPDGNDCLSIEESYGCNLRGNSSLGLYFRRRNKKRELWDRDVEQFVQALELEAIE